MTEIQNQVKEFHEAMDLPIGKKPGMISDDRVKLRLRLIAEEFFETLSAATGATFLHAKDLVMDAINGSKPNESLDIEEFVDGLADLDYVVEGSRTEMGIDGGPIAEEVHAANMRKVGGQLREDGKKQKPIGWVGPNIKQRLIDQGWEFK